VRGADIARKCVLTVARRSKWGRTECRRLSLWAII